MVYYSYNMTSKQQAQQLIALEKFKAMQLTKQQRDNVVNLLTIRGK